MKMLWFLFKYLILVSILTFLLIAANVDWWDEDGRRSFLLLLSFTISVAPATISYLEFGDWLSFKRRK
ncbi:TMhelix containing protein [Vibrio phage 1.084.O._10N.261.49.F5]|nr:TMhelix containing protein [Vibrio phage 1.084.O._10N.261.49.F5]